LALTMESRQQVLFLHLTAPLVHPILARILINPAADISFRNLTSEIFLD